MNLEELVPLQETCKRLHELGWKEETYFEWVPRVGKSSIVRPCNKNNVTDSLAPTASKLGEMLPSHVNDYALVSFKLDINEWYCGYEDIDLGRLTPYFRHENEAECRANLLIWLIENKHLTL